MFKNITGSQSSGVGYLFLKMNMKQAIIFLLLLVATVTGYAQQQAEPTKGPRFKFKDSNIHNFGTFDMGPQKVYEFEFTNVGNEPLIITGAMASCGCTTPEWPKEPILPGKSNKITVRYNSAGHPGSFSKTVF